MVSSNEEHLAKGSPCPPLDPNKVRIYAMRFCPYAQRALLTSAAKNVDSDVVFVNLKDKPEWIFDKNAGGKVPAVEVSDGKVLYESLIVADYFDDAYPEGRKLHSSDPFQKAKDRIVIENFGRAGGLAYKMSFIPDTLPEEIPQLAEEYEKIIAELSQELEKRGTKFFGGDDAPGMLDYMIWPWFERRPTLELQHPNVDFAKLREGSKPIEEWVERMKQDPAVKTWYLPPQVHFDFNQTVRSGNPNFNFLLC